MVIDTSAMMSMIRREPEAEPFARAVHADPKRLVSVISLVEAGIVVERQFGAAGSRELDYIIERFKLTIVPVSVEIGRGALLAFWRFGKGVHPAGLNFGDCFVYALARSLGEPLLFKGEDFSRTDVRPVFWR